MITLYCMVSYVVVLYYMGMYGTVATDLEGNTSNCVLDWCRKLSLQSLHSTVCDSILVSQCVTSIRHLKGRLSQI